MPEISDNHIAHLGMIQGIINRMAANSFALKALTVAISAAIIAITGTQQNIVSYVGLFPVLVFWLMDAKYLRLEQLYRKLYDHIRKDEEFEAFSMNTKTFDADVPLTIWIAITWSVGWFYLAVTVSLVAVSCLPYILNRGILEDDKNVFFQLPVPQCFSSEPNSVDVKNYR